MGLAAEAAATTALGDVNLSQDCRLVRILFSDAFLPAVPLLWIMAPGVLAYACAGILGTYFKGYRLPVHLFLGGLPGTGGESDGDSRALSGGRRLSRSLGAALGNYLPARPSRGGVRKSDSNALALDLAATARRRGLLLAGVPRRARPRVTLQAVVDHAGTPLASGSAPGDAPRGAAGVLSGRAPCPARTGQRHRP